MTRYSFNKSQMISQGPKGELAIQRFIYFHIKTQFGYQHLSLKQCP